MSKTSPAESMKEFPAAQRREKRGRDYYKRVSAIDHPIAKATFQFLTQRQEKYLELIQEFGQALARNTVRFPALRAPETVIENLLAKHPPKGIPNRDIFKAYLWAFKFEESGAAVYARIAARNSQEATNRLFAFLRGQKAEHYRILDETLSCLHHPKHYFENMASFNREEDTFCTDV